MEFTRLTILLIACTLIFAVCALGTMALQDEPSNSTIQNSTVPAPPQKTIPVEDTQEPIQENITPDPMSQAEETQTLEEDTPIDNSLSSDETPIEDGQNTDIANEGIKEPIIQNEQPAVTPIATNEKPATEPIKGVKCCHTNETQTYSGDYYQAKAGPFGEIYLGAANKNKEFIIIPVNK